MRYAFLDNNSVLKAHGFVETNEPDNTRIEVTENFDLKPGEWKLVNNNWQEV